MSDETTSGTTQTSGTTPPPTVSENGFSSEGFEQKQARQLSQAGLIFIYAGMVTLLIAVAVSVILVVRETYPEGAVEFFSYYGLPLLLVAASAMFSAFGYLVLRTVSISRRQVIPTQDRELLTQLIKGDPPAGLDAYVRLSALSLG